MEPTSRINSYLINFRDISLFVDARYKIKKGMLYRSGSLAAITGDDLDYLTGNIGLRTYCDFRTKEEIACFGKPDLLIKNGVEWINLPINDQNRVFQKILMPTADDYARSYLNALETAGKTIFLLLDLLKGSQVYFPLVFGCTAGKDRTGVISVIILKLLGVDEANIAADYAKSSDFLIQRIDYFQPFWEKKGITKKQYSIRLYPKAQTIHLLFAYIKKEYGDFDNYMEQIGITRQMAAELNQRFIL